jgi:hypothetical protein
MTKTKKLRFYTCRFFHDVKRRILCIDIFKNDKLVHKAQMVNMDRETTNNIIRGFDDEMANEIKSLEEEII